MNINEQIKEALKRISGEQTSEFTFLAKVTSVNETDATISVDLDSDLIIEDVRLRSTIDGDNGMYAIPEIDSMVLITKIGLDDTFFVIGCAKYSKIICKGTSISLEINQENIIFNSNVLNSYLTDINKLVSKINTLESQINSLKTIFTNWIPAPNDGGAALKTAATTWSAQQITATTVNDIKDPKIKN